MDIKKNTISKESDEKKYLSLIVTNLCDESAQGGFIPRAVIIYECSSPLKSPLKCRQTVLCPHSSGHRDESGHETSCGHFNEGEHS